MDAESYIALEDAKTKEQAAYANHRMAEQALCYAPAKTPAAAKAYANRLSAAGRAFAELQEARALVLEVIRVRF